MKDLADSSSEKWEELWSLMADLKTIEPADFFTTHGGNMDEEGFIELPWNEYHICVVKIEMLLYDLHVVQEDIGWSEWKSQVDPKLVFDADRIRSASLYDTVCLITGIVRSERYGSGAIAKSLLNGIFVELLKRLRVLLPESSPLE